MPLYTVRVRLVPVYQAPRGSNFVEMTHHFVFEDDATAAEEFSNLAPHWHSGALGSRWVVARGADVHEIALFRRDPSDRRVWTLIDREMFSVADYFEVPFEVVLPEVSIGVLAQEGPWTPSTRRAVMVREETENPLVKRRVYIGPLSQVGMFATLDLTLIDVPATLLLGHPVHTEDFVPRAGDSPIERVPDSISAAVTAHCADIADVLDTGFPVVHSWLYNATFPSQRWRASEVWAELRSRSRRGGMTAPAVLG